MALDIGAKTHAWASEIDGKHEQGTVDNTATALLTFHTRSATEPV